MLLTRGREKARSRAKVKALSKSNVACLFPHGFTPNPGAQSQVFELVSLDPAKPDLATHDWIWYKGGINSGKSFGGAGFICSGALKDPASRQLITAMTYGQLKNSTLVALAEFCKTFGVPLNPVADVPMDSPAWADMTAKMIASNRFCTVFGAPILVLSAEAFTGRTERSPESGRGLQVRRIWADEFAYAEESAFSTIDGRLGRGPGSLNQVGLITSSINKNQPYNWIYRLFDDPERPEERHSIYLSIKGSSKENVHADPNFYTRMSASLSPTLAKIELEAEYAIASEGRVYPDFDRVLNNCSDTPTIDEVLHIGIDFNLGINAAIVFVIRNGLPRAVAEHWGSRDTPALAEQLRLAYPEQHARRKIAVYPDATGKQRSRTNAELSDISILRDAGFSVHANDSNPRVADRIATTNALIKNALGDRRLKVNVAKCPRLTNAYEKQIYNDKFEPDKTSGLDHYEESAGYFLNFRFPVVANRIIERSGFQIY